MKKVIPVLMAAVMAIGFSAFSTVKDEDVYYKNPGSDDLLPTTISACPEFPNVQCVKIVPEENDYRPLFKANGLAYKRQ